MTRIRQAGFTILGKTATTVDVGMPRIFLGKLNRFLLKRSRSYPSGAYPQAMMKLNTIARRLVATLNPIDVLVFFQELFGGSSTRQTILKFNF